MIQKIDRIGTDPLSSEDNEAIFRNRIVPELFAGKTAQATPLGIILSGQSGIGKSSTTNRIVAELGGDRQPVVINNDILREYYPNYRKLLQFDASSATGYARQDKLIWVAKALAYACEHRFNILLDGNTSDPPPQWNVSLSFVKLITELKPI